MPSEWGEMELGERKVINIHQIRAMQLFDVEQTSKTKVQVLTANRGTAHE